MPSTPFKVHKIDSNGTFEKIHSADLILRVEDTSHSNKP